MKKILLALLLVGMASAIDLEEGGYFETANLSKNWTTTHGSPWFYQYFMSNQSRINMTQTCSVGGSSNYQCWQSGEIGNNLAVGLYPLTYNISISLGTGGGSSFPNPSFRYYFTRNGTYYINGTLWCYGGGAYCNADGMNYTVFLKGNYGTEVCVGDAVGNGGAVKIDCPIGVMHEGEFAEVTFGANTAPNFDYGNLSTVIYRNQGFRIHTVTPINLTGNGTNVIPFGFQLFGDFNYPIVNATVFYNESGWTELASNTTTVYNNSWLGTSQPQDISWINATFPRASTWLYSIRACNQYHCNSTANFTITTFSNLTAVINSPANNSANMTLNVPVAWTPASNYPLKNATLYSNYSGWNVIGQNTTSVINGTINWINVTFPIHGNFTISVRFCDISDACNMTANQTINLTAPRLYIQAFDAISLGRIYFNAQLSNTTNTTTFGNNYWLNKSFYEIPTSASAVTVTITNSSYFPASYSKVLDLNATNDSAFSVYLTPISNYSIHLVQLIVRDVIGSGIQGAIVTVQQLIGGVYTTIASQTSDSAGQTAFYLDSLTSYQIIISATGFETQTNIIVPSGSQYTFTLSGTAVGGYFFAYNDTTFNILPAWYLDYPYFSVNVTVTSVGLSYYGFNGTLANTTQLFYANSTGGYGGTLLSQHINRTNWQGTLYVTVFYKKDGADEFQFVKTYAFTNSTNTNSSLTGIVANIRAASFSPTLKIVVAGFISLIFAVGIGTLGSFGLAGSGIAFIIGFAFFGLTLDFVEPSLFYVITLLALAIYVIKSGIR